MAAPITFPPTLTSENGTLALSLSLQAKTHTVANSNGFTMTTRLLNGIFPGPTLRLKPGDTLEIDFTNELEDQGIPYVHNKFSASDETNIHFHGLHVSGELPSDDATHVIRPGESYDYQTTLPSDHMPGTHWLHPHRHGSTSLQVGGGAAAAIIVEDPPNFLPSQVETAKDVLFLVQEIEIEEVLQVARRSGDRLLAFSPEGRPSFLTVNGQENPLLVVEPGEWIRLRIIWAAWQNDSLDLNIPGCEMQLLAKDGIYIRDFPRSIDLAEIPLGGRADIMVRCSKPSESYTVQGLGGRARLATIQTTTDSAVPSADLEPWSPLYPNYLSDLRNAIVSPGCSCETDLGEGGWRRNAINGISFDVDNDYLHTTFLGAVVERTIIAYDHPYHQHVYPYQLVSGFRGGNGYHAAGDWQDTVMGKGTIRYQPTAFTGKMMVHCHHLEHEDKGMMAIENVVDGNGTCSCTGESGTGSRLRGDNVAATGWDGYRAGRSDLVVPVAVSIGVALVLAVASFFIYKRSKSAKQHSASTSSVSSDAH